jgi:hypothetical protein
MSQPFTGEISLDIWNSTHRVAERSSGDDRA